MQIREVQCFGLLSLLVVKPFDRWVMLSVTSTLLCFGVLEVQDNRRFAGIVGIRRSTVPSLPEREELER
jgi:hypothetical protein